MSTATSQSGIIAPDILYRLPEAQSRLGWGSHAMRQARRKGLQVRYAGRNGYLLGRDIIAFIERTGRNEK